MRQSIILAVSAALVAAALPFAAQAQGHGCEWLAGDFHVHTVYSHDSWGGPGSKDDNTNPASSLPGAPDDAVGEAITLGFSPGEQGRLAESRELDFIAITDHDDMRAQADPWFGEYGKDFVPNPPGKSDLIWVPNYENTMNGGAPGAGGHAQMHGAQLQDVGLYERHRLAPEDPRFGPPLSVIETAELLDSKGGAYQINHPYDMKWHNDQGAYELPGWAPHSLEVWNIGAWGYQPPFPATNDHEFPLMMWNELLDQGFHVAGTGGSDNHWRSTAAAQGVGQPTTWVCAEDRTWQAIVDGVRANRTSISHQPPAYQGPRVYLYADDAAEGREDEFQAMIGDTVTPGSRVTAEVENAEGAHLRLITNPAPDTGERVLATREVGDFSFAETFEVPTWVTWLRVEVFYEDAQDIRRGEGLRPACDGFERLTDAAPGLEDENVYCKNRLAMVAMTSPIYFKASDPTPTPTPTFDPATALTYAGDTEVKVNKTATFAATLTDASGDPLAGQVVTFTFRGETLTDETDESGLATVQTKVKNPRGPEVLHVNFAGSDPYDPAHLEQTITVTNGKG